MKELFTQINLIGFILKIFGLVVMAWGILKNLSFVAQMGGGLTLDDIFFVPLAVGLLFIGFGEVIDLLQKIHDQSAPEETIESTQPVASAIPLDSEQQLEEFYSKMNIEIESIAPTKHRDVFRVTVEGRAEYIELGGHSPRLLTGEEAEPYI